jgi:hypothetical protein
MLLAGIRRGDVTPDYRRKDAGMTIGNTDVVFGECELELWALFRQLAHDLYRSMKCQSS